MRRGAEYEGKAFMKATESSDKYHFSDDSEDDSMSVILMMNAISMLMIPNASTLVRRRSSWKMRDVQRSFSARPSMAEMCHL